ncbi:hypothetical protein WN48_09098 [Eufriesea mexicana]|uniref:Uncharacterized protein n=1 Tax=Eufriesea mexicana TaxID=516756 RepID=A0A310S3W2_9HYME|nr:hypothetical protein WN48_09098 [Eufriesea mexicana]
MLQPSFNESWVLPFADYTKQYLNKVGNIIITGNYQILNAHANIPFDGLIG